MHRSPSRKTGEAPPPKGLPFLVEWPVAFLLVMLARLPYLLGDHVFFDGDEAIIGIMARDLLSLNGSPFYFYGQQYGFSLFETLAAALFTVFLGSGVASLKLGGMLLFSLGIQRLMRVLRSKGLPWSGYLLFALVLAMFPPWTVWGTMLRGGYITAFVAVCFIIEHLLLYPVWQRRHWLAVGLSVAVIAVSQVFFVLVVFPLLTQRLLAMSRRDILPVFGLGLMALVLLRLPAYLNPDLWMPTGMGSVHVCNLFHRFIAGFWSYFTGFFLYEYEVAVPTGLRIACMVFVALMSVLLLLVIWRSPKAANVDLLLLALGTVMAAFPITLFEQGGGRYLLGFFTGMMVFVVYLAIAAQHIRPRLGTVWALLLVMALAPAAVGYRHYVNSLLSPELNDMTALHQLQSAMQDGGIRYAIVPDWQLIWQLNYLSDEKAGFRSQYARDRMDRYYDRVNDCFLEEDCTIGVAGTHWALSGIDPSGIWAEDVRVVNGRYFLVEDPKVIFLETAGFSLPAPDALSR